MSSDLVMFKAAGDLLLSYFGGNTTINQRSGDEPDPHNPPSALPREGTTF